MDRAEVLPLLGHEEYVRIRACTEDMAEGQYNALKYITPVANFI